MDKHLIITLPVADRKYSLKIERKDEQIYRDAVKAIEKKTNAYRNYFSGTDKNKLDDKDFLIMTTIQALSQQVAVKTQNKILEDKIKNLTLELEAYLRINR